MEEQISVLAAQLVFNPYQLYLYLKFRPWRPSGQYIPAALNLGLLHSNQTVHAVLGWLGQVSKQISIRLHDKVSFSKEHPTHTQVDCNDMRPQTAQFHNERISTDLNLVTWQSTVHQPPDNGLKYGTEICKSKFLSVLIWILVLFKVSIVCVHELEY